MKPFFHFPYMALEVDRFRVTSLREGGHWIFGFAVLAIFRSVFRFLCPKTSVFLFWCSLRLADFPFFSIWFSVSVKNTDGFSDLISDTVSGFPYLTYLGSGFSSIWAAITRLHWSRIAAKGKCYGEECMTNQLKYRRDPLVAYAQQYPPPPQKWGEGRVRPHVGYG